MTNVYNFFHECGRHVGGVPRSSLKGGKRSMMRGKEQKQPQSKPKNTTNPAKPQNAKNRFTLIKKCFLCAKVRHVRKTEI